ncbi:hypothetical protein B0H11DRAFT_2247756 [Mycena galericulata]|nr:hypothetical protein B0H11DRAFT_2247756 [Mycena galericulata]
MSGFPNSAPPAYPTYAAGAPGAATQSLPTSATPPAAAAYPAGAPGAATQNQSAWTLLSQAANAMAVAANQVPAQGPGGPVNSAPAPLQAPANAPAAPTNGGIRMTGPWVAGELYGVVPTGPLQAVPDNAEKWFAITKGRYIGVTNSAAIADGAVSRVSNALRAGYTSQGEALQAFNTALAMNALNLGLVAVVG